MRALIMLVLILGAFGGGFYAGARYAQSEMVKNPDAFFEAYQAELEKTAKTKYDKIKKVLLEDQ